MAKKKSAAELKEEGATLNGVLAGARKRDHNFALLIGKEGLVLEADPKKSADVMRRQAKANGGGAKGAQGVMRVVGKVVEFHCAQDDPPRALRKMTQQHFRERGVQVKVMIQTPSGAQPDEEDDVAEADGAAIDQSSEGDVSPDETSRQMPSDGAANGAESAAQASQAALHQERLRQDFAVLERRVDSVQGGGDIGLAKKTAKLAETIRMEIDRDAPKATKVMTLLRTTLDKAGVPDAPAPVAPSDSTQGTGSTGQPDAQTPATLEAAMTALSTSFGSLWDSLTAPAPEDPAQKTEREAIAQQRETLTALYEAGPLDAQRALEVAREFARLSQMMATAKQTEAMAKTHPEAANATREAIAGFDAVLGPGTVVTPDVIAQIEQARVDAELAEQAARGALAQAQALPAGPERDSAVATAEAELARAEAEVTGCNGKLKAAKGKSKLMAAITTGGLMPDSPTAYSDTSAAEFVKAFERNPDLASYAVDTARKMPNPEAVAGGMDMLCTHLDNGFAGPDGRLPPEGFDQAGYARNLIQGAGREGRGYMEGARSYIEAGHHLTTGAIPSGNGDTVDGRSRDRTQFIAAELLGANGTIEMDQDAETALGHLRFSPETVDAPTPLVNARVLDMYALLRDDTKRSKAEETLSKMGAPRGRGADLVEMAGSGDAERGAPTVENGRRAVLSALMMPVHQGDAGSCHATAGVRRLSENTPLKAMERYAELVTTGTFTPGDGQPPVQAVLRFPPDEDPLIRSLEYSAASAMAGKPDRPTSPAMMLEASLTQAVDGLMGPVGDGVWLSSKLGRDNWEVDKEIIRKALRDSFTVEYSAEAVGDATASDGYSKAGAYLLVQTAPQQRVINSRDLFTDALTECVVSALAIDPASDKAADIRETIAAGGYSADMVDGFGDMPWKMGGGGYPTLGDEVIFGGKRALKDIVGDGTPRDAVTDKGQGERTATLLEGLVDHFEGASVGMVPLTVSGKKDHAFNGLPDHPSLSVLKGEDTGAKIETHLIAPGREIASKELSVAEAQRVFEAVVAGVRIRDGAEALAAFRATASTIKITDRPTTPDALVEAIETAMAPALKTLAEDLANAWQQQQIADGQPCSDADRDAKAARDVVTYREGLSAAATSALIGATGAPVFTIADTNWGDGSFKKTFVVAPDPRTGAPRMWQHVLPENKFIPAGDGWENGKWMDVAEVN